MQSSPITAQTVVSLTNMQIESRFLKYGVCNFESDKYISIRDEGQNQAGQLSILELETKNLTRKPNKSESVLMHPQENIIALKAKQQTGAGHLVQIFNMGKKEKLKDLSFTENVVYWKWFSAKKLAIVTTVSVYHVDITNPNENQVKVLDRFGNLAQENVQIIGYTVETNEKWCALFGISTPDGGQTINGHIQLYLIEGGKSQQLEGHCCTFGEAYIHSDTYKSSIFCFYEKKQDQLPKIHISEIGVPMQGATKHKKQCEFQPDPQYPNDFPVVMHVCQKYGLLMFVTKYGFLYAYEITSTQMIYKFRISESPVFVGTKDSKNDGMYVIAKNGNVILCRVEPAALVPHILNNCKYISDVVQLGFKLASRFQLPGVDNIFIEQFKNALVQNDYRQAAQIASQAPGTLLRNPQTIAQFKQLPQQPGQPSPLLVYFQTILEKTTLYKNEALELCGPILQSGRKQYVENWLRDNKLECSEELGDMVKPHDSALSLQIYKKANVHAKVVQNMMESGQMDQAMSYSQQTGANLDYTQVIRNALLNNPEGALNVAKSLCKQNPNINVHNIAELFMNANRPQEMTGFLVECMKNNRSEDGPWQTKVLEYNLMAAPQVAETILSMDLWSQYNKQKIGNLCEQKGLFQRALQNYTEMKDIRRCILNTHGINPEWLVEYIGSQQADNILVICQDLIKHNRNNFQLVVNVFSKNYQKMELANCIKVFETVGSFDGIYLFLGTIINSIDDKDIVYKYIEASTKCNQLRIVEQIIMDRVEHYDPVKVKAFLMEMKLPDPKPLIRLCDIHGYIEELTQYLYRNGFNKYIEIFLFKVNPTATPMVLGSLIDLECDENYIKQILYNIRGNCPIDPLIDEFEKRNKLRVIENWLESRVAEGNQMTAVHNALAKIKIDTNQDIDNFLVNNQNYDPKVIGKFCEDLDPHLAVIAYKRSWGTCDQELIMVTNKNALFQIQARYLVERQSKELWQNVLTEDNPYRRQVIDQVVAQALPDSKSVDEVSLTVQAFMEAQLPLELLALLEKIVLHNPEFGQYKKLQNLLLITAIKSEKSRVLDYINKLNNYDGYEIAKIALGEEYQLYEEAFVIYKKNNYHVEAIEVLLHNIEDIPRAAEFAEKINLPEVYTKLANAYLSQFQVSEAINNFLKAKDSSQYQVVIQRAEDEAKFEELIAYLTMCREKVKDQYIDNSLAFCYSKLEKLTQLEDFIGGPNSVDCQRVGDRLYEQKLYEAAKLLFIQIKNNSKIASCLVRLRQFQKAIDAAKKANTPKTWKELCKACVEAQEFRLAAVSGMNIIIHPDHLEDLIKHYEEWGHQSEMISLLETGMGLERAHVGIYTELGVLLAKYQSQRLMEHIKLYFQKLNVSKLLRICNRLSLWSEAVYLHSNYHEYDNALNIMMEHSPVAFTHDAFVNLILKCSNTDLYYKSMYFYLEEQPDKINDLLKCLTTKIDIGKCVNVMRKTGYLKLILPFLKSVQNVNNKELNEALNEMHLELEDYEALKQSISQYEAFDQAGLAKLCERHELTQFRRIAAFLYRKAKQFDLSIKLSKQDEEYRDCIETAQESQKIELVEDLLRFFVSNGQKEFFAACLYTCYEYIKPDVVLELAWRFGMTDYAFPFFIQITRELTHRVDNVQKTQDQKEKEDAKKANEQQNKPLDFVGDMINNNPFGQNMLMPPSDIGGMGQTMGPFAGNFSMPPPNQNQFGIQNQFQNNLPGNQFGNYQTSNNQFGY